MVYSADKRPAESIVKGLLCCSCLGSVARLANGTLIVTSSTSHHDGETATERERR